MLYSLIIALILLPFCFIVGFRYGRICGQAEAQVKPEKPKRKHKKYVKDERQKEFEQDWAAINDFCGPKGVIK